MMLHADMKKNGAFPNSNQLTFVNRITDLLTMFWSMFPQHNNQPAVRHECDFVSFAIIS
jgi:hypothetical protein